MLDFQKCKDQDLKVAKAIEKKRQIEAERRARIFNPRVRRIGIDKEFLDRQVEEKKQQRDLEREEECRLDEALLRSSQLAILLSHQQDQERRKLNKEINDFRQTHQKPETRRDFDLYDPESLKKSKPLRECDDDSLGPASAQKFEGEDENAEKRRLEQQEQMQHWIFQQVHERREAERERQEAEQAYQEILVSRDNRAYELERLERECQRKLSLATAKFNQSLAEEREQRRRILQAEDEEDKRAEIYNFVTGDFLNESKDQAESRLGPHRPLAGRYKGMTSEQLRIFREGQAKQKEEMQRLREEENKRNEEWNKLMTGNAIAAEFYQRELNRKKAELNKQIAEENRKLAEQQKQHQDYLNQHVYKNKPSSEFYAQFNKSTR